MTRVNDPKEIDGCQQHSEQKMKLSYQIALSLDFSRGTNA